MIGCSTCLRLMNDPDFESDSCPVCIPNWLIKLKFLYVLLKSAKSFCNCFRCDTSPVETLLVKLQQLSPRAYFIKVFTLFPQIVLRRANFGNEPRRRTLPLSADVSCLQKSQPQLKFDRLPKSWAFIDLAKKDPFPPPIDHELLALASLLRTLDVLHWTMWLGVNSVQIRTLKLCHP